MRDPVSWRRAVVGLAVVWLTALVVAVALRIGFPLELEWMEGGSLQHAHWIQQGHPVYPAPSADFVPFLYTPLYAVVLAGLGSVFPLGFVLGRVVSVAAWLAIGMALVRAVDREGKTRTHAVAAVGLMCGGYVFSFRWMDLARADTLFMALVVWGLVLLREARDNHRRAAVAGLLIALAFWTKQTAFVFVLASGVGALLVAPRQLPTYAGVIALVDGGGVLLGNWLSEGMLWTYIYELHQAHAFNHERFRVKTWGMFLHAAPFAAGLVLAAVVRLYRSRFSKLAADRAEYVLGRWSEANGGRVYWLLMLVAGLVASALSYSTQWAEPNAFIPGVVLGALFIGVSLPEGGRSEAVALAAVAAQLLFSAVLEPRYQPIQDDGVSAIGRSYVLHDPMLTIPSGARREAAQTLRDELESGDQRVLALHRPWWSILAGGPGHVGSMGITDVEKAAQARITAELRRRLREGEVDAVWLEGEPPGWMRRELGRGYRLERRLAGEDRVRPMSGYMSEAGMVTEYRRPQLLFRAAAPRPPEPGARVVMDFEGGSLGGLQREGEAFGSRSVRPLTGKERAVGPHGGGFFLSSGTGSGSRKLVGTATSGRIEVGAGDIISLYMGGTRASSRLRVEVLAAERDEVLASLAVEGPPFMLERRVWSSGSDGAVRLRFVDADPKGSLYVDDVRVVPARP